MLKKLAVILCLVGSVNESSAGETLIGFHGTWASSSWVVAGDESRVASNWRLSPVTPRLSSTALQPPFGSTGGYGGGVTLILPLRSGFHLVFQPGTVSRGAEWDETRSSSTTYFDSASRTFRPVTINESISQRVTQRYFELPILGKVLLGKGRLRPYLEAGPTIAFLTSASQKASRTVSGDPAAGVANIYGTQQNVNAERKAQDRFLGTEVGVTAGLGVDYAVKSARVFVEGRVSRGFSNTDKTTTQPDVKNADFQVRVGVFFALK